jgi:murein DD-endopeptidase MepM/ murein hydrolase activator NlpD
MGLRRQHTSRKPGQILLFFLIILLVAAGGVSFLLFFEGNKPAINLTALPDYLGKTDTVDFEVTDVGSGLRTIEVTASQPGLIKELYAQSNPRIQYTGQIGPLEDKQSLPFDAAKLGFKDGPIEIKVTARDFSFRGMFNGNSAVASKTVSLDTKPPLIRILHSEKYISPGGAGIAIYTLSDSDSEHGVRINGKLNGGHPVSDGRKDTYIAYFSLPFDSDTIDSSSIEATDVAGNSTQISFEVVVKKTEQKHDRINISDGFLSVKIPEFEQYYPDLPGNLVEKYLYTNQAIRDENNSKIAELCSTPHQDRLWKGRFIRMPGSGKAGFADHRTYYYNDKPIDKQVHLGMDIASTQHAKVKAANAGQIVFADYLGIYGNMVLIDHGQGVFSLYSHLSQINVGVDDMVASGDIIGLTGTSGMAGGDHLHFSMLINGIFTTPKEWWDPHWIEVTIEGPLTNSKF